MFRVSDDGAVRWLVIDNPDRRNAIDTKGWDDLAEHLRDFEASDARALVVTGAGDDFCSGADLGGNLVTDDGIVGRYAQMSRVGAAARALHTLTKPSIAAVDGVAVGAGLNLALGCDIVIATDRVRLSEIFVKRGLTVDFGGTWLLPRLVGLAVAKDLALTGRMVEAEEALRLGLVSRVVASDDLASVAGEVAAELAAGAPLAQRFIKTGFDRSHEMSFDEALAYEDQAQAILLMSEDVVEGVTAFAQKRPPEFRGR